MFLRFGLPTLVLRSAFAPAPRTYVLRGFDALEILTIACATAFVVVGFIYLF
jgi:hypothetical protein